ncbi:phosphatidylserine decarboxylase-domain-containing protein [Pisolithus albus]|nr:phosphatidylserine decarboxylase-domain-containing protein [Pisolithus albus]
MPEHTRRREYRKAPLVISGCIEEAPVETGLVESEVSRKGLRDGKGDSKCTRSVRAALSLTGLTVSHKDEAERYIHGSFAIFRLAPQGYHRFHVPVEGMIGKMMDILENIVPQAIWSVLDMYSENARKIIPITSGVFGRWSIRTVVHEGQRVSRGDELGYFAFVGSTIVMLLEKGMVEWDEDLLIDGRASLERELYQIIRATLEVAYAVKRFNLTAAVPRMPAAQKRVGFEREKKRWGRNLPRLRENIVSDYVIDTDSRVEPIAFIALRKISDEKSALYGVPTVRCGHSTTVTGVNRTKSTILVDTMRREEFTECCDLWMQSYFGWILEEGIADGLELRVHTRIFREQTIHLTGDTDDEEVFTAKPKHHYSPVCPQRLSTLSIPSSPTRLTAPFPIPIVGPNVACTSTGPLTPKLQNHLTDSTGKITISAVSEDMRPFAQAYNRMLDILGEVISVAERALQN